MKKDKELEALEQKAWTSMFQDGLWEIFIGLLALTMAIGITLDELRVDDMVSRAIIYPMHFIGVPLIYFGKRYMTVPRIGRAKFSRSREARRINMMLMLLVSFLAVFGIWMFIAIFQPDTAHLGSVIITALIFTVFSVLAYHFGLKRFYAVAVLMAIGEPMLVILRAQTDLVHVGFLAWGIPGIILLIMGSVALGQFLKRYPVPGKGAVGESSNAA
jgi:Na+/proline symporter